MALAEWFTTLFRTTEIALNYLLSKKCPSELNCQIKYTPSFYGSYYLAVSLTMFIFFYSLFSLPVIPYLLTWPYIRKQWRAEKDYYTFKLRQYIHKFAVGNYTHVFSRRKRFDGFAPRKELHHHRHMSVRVTHGYL